LTFCSYSIYLNHIPALLPASPAAASLPGFCCLFVPLCKPAPDQLHLEAVAFVSRFDQLASGEQVEGVVQFIGEVAGQGFPADYSPFPLCRQETQQGQPSGVYLILLDVGEEEAAVSTEGPSMGIQMGKTKGHSTAGLGVSIGVGVPPSLMITFTTMRVATAATKAGKTIHRLFVLFLSRHILLDS
jgi:hypothetical protein